jgi:hypothetical protein
MIEDRIPEQETLRDRFAMAALTGMLSNGIVNSLDFPANQKRLTKIAYEFADTMLEARKRSK